MRLSDDQYQRDMHRHDLAKWMISHDAKTGTVSRWTGLSRYQVQKLSLRYHPGGRTRRRGILPSQTAYFGKSASMEAESLAFIFMAVETQVIPEHISPDARRVLPDLSRGERLMEAFECYRALVPVSRISLERAILLVFEYAARRNLSVRRCVRCNDVMLAQRFGARYDRCPFCRKESRPEVLCAQT